MPEAMQVPAEVTAAATRAYESTACEGTGCCGHLGGAIAVAYARGRLDEATKRAAELLAEATWQREQYGDGKDRVAVGRIIGTQDAAQAARARVTELLKHVGEVRGRAEESRG